MASSPNNAYAQQVAQIAELKARSSAIIQTAIRGVSGGFVVSGQVQYQDKDTKNTVLAENGEAVASTAEAAHALSLNYHVNGGSFAAPTDNAQPNLFLNPNPTTI